VGTDSAKNKPRIERSDKKEGKKKKRESRLLLVGRGKEVQTLLERVLVLDKA